MFYILNDYAITELDVEPVIINSLQAAWPGGEHDEDDDFDEEEDEEDVPGIADGDAAEEALPVLDDEDLEDADIDEDEIEDIEWDEEDDFEEEEDDDDTEEP
ncbi:hypothetical protein HNQ91_001297 [Filimonas zeae]|uniref:Uncharacterized protein n=1 Tax=Filimonas zeae TaxID=1737353 RepID=A0A917ISS0_9BACT|nr:hypothetical protein [Filimonas zeae]MDR6338275.1 hypothetical protein [Filimonas zeae]GGH62598.1 hypothetical protein GCM10011379_12700 [Filimonas zeae]